MFLAEILMQNELAELNSEIEKGSFHIADLRSGEYDFYNESVITRLQNKIFRINQDIKDLFLGNYLTKLQELGQSQAKAHEKEFLYNDILTRLERELTQYKNSIARYIRANFGLVAVEAVL